MAASASTAGRRRPRRCGTDGPARVAVWSCREEDAEAEVRTSGESDRAVSELRDRYLRLAAEFDNYRKRTTRERSESGARAQGELLKHFIDSLDDLGRVAAVDPAATDARSVVDGVDLVAKKLLKALTAAGLELIEPINQTFDPSVHEAVATEPALSPEDDHVVSQVFQPGYRFGGQLLRPARVVVRQWSQ